jgi:hypothetical protein
VNQTPKNSFEKIIYFEIDFVEKYFTTETILRRNKRSINLILVHY